MPESIPQLEGAGTVSPEDVICIDRMQYEATEVFLSEARQAWLNCPMSLFMHPTLRAMWAALDRIDGPITEWNEPESRRVEGGA